VTALAVLVSLAAVFADNRRPVRAEQGSAGSGPAAGAVAGPALLDPAVPGGPVASLLTVTRFAAGGPPGSPRALVSLRPAHYHGTTPNGTSESILAHEIVRQAVLLAARDAGAVARDGTIGDALPEGAAPADLEVGSLLVHGRTPVVVLARPSDKGRDVLATFDLGGPLGPIIDYQELVVRAEALSRSLDGFPKVLERVGLAGPAAGPKPAGRPGEDVSRRLAQLTCTEPFAAVQALNAEVREQEESPDRLGSLVRGYANLGVLTEFHWSPRHKAFKARALLTAQRLVARDPRSPLGLWHRAYAEALTGFHKAALDDLAAAEPLAKNAPAGSKAPAWVALIDAFCRFQTAKLVAARSGPDGQLAMLLAFMTVEESGSNPVRTVKLGLDLLSDNPECYRVHDALSGLGGVINGRAATVDGMKDFTRSVPRRLQAIPGLPERAATRLRNGGSDMEAAGALVEAGRGEGDTGEPSWAVLGRMIGDVRFAQVVRRADFMKNAWSVPAEVFVAEARPLVDGHPYRDFVESFGADPGRERDRHAAWLKGVAIPDIDLAATRFLSALSLVDRARYDRLHAMMVSHSDVVYRDLARLLTHGRREGIPETARRAALVSPFAPISKSKLVETDWAGAEPRAREWEDGAGEHPDVLVALGNRFLALKRWDDAERCLNKAIGLSPEIATYKLLSESHKGRGDLDRWKATLDRALGQRDEGLDHMQIRVEIARHLMALRQFDKALPYAEAAAATWASAGMLCASNCREAMRDWEQAELWARRTTERYPEDSWEAWFIWCKRTGRGDVTAARRFALRHVASSGDDPTDDLRQRLVNFYLVDGSTREALARLRPLNERNQNPLAALIIATLADEQGDSAERDREFGRLAALPAAKELKVDVLAQAIRDGLANDPGGRIDPKPVTAALGNVPASSRDLYAVFTARLLHAHGAPEEAKAILHRSVARLGTVGWAQALASISLRDWGGRVPGDEPKTAK
jgi:tetratricopeptide (TPR) repeat protein